MVQMPKRVLLHTQFSTFSTYHAHGEAGLMIMQNPSLYNHILNNAIMLECNRRFLNGYTTPDIQVSNSGIGGLPFVEHLLMPCKFLDGYVHTIIRKMIDLGYYVAFTRVDDYYIPNKSWYKESHRLHDGIICGYDQEKKTYFFFSYDKNWVFRVFESPQLGFEKGILSAAKMGQVSSIRAFKSSADKVAFDPKSIISSLKEYLNNTFEKFPLNESGIVRGIAVHDFLKIYINRIDEGIILHEHIDPRSFRMLWEHKKCMYDRIKAMESHFNTDHLLSDEYQKIVTIADRARIMYAMYQKKERKDTLLKINECISSIVEGEKSILNKFIETFERMV